MADSNFVTLSGNFSIPQTQTTDVPDSTQELPTHNDLVLGNLTLYFPSLPTIHTGHLTLRQFAQVS